MSTTASTTLHPIRDARLVPYCVLAIGVLGAALMTGRAALAALAAPFVLALALGLRRTGAVDVTARVTLDADQVLEGDVVDGMIEIGWNGELEPQVLLHRLRGVAAVADDITRSWEMPASATSLRLPIRLHATHWGRHSIGEVWLRLRAPFGLVSWTGRVATAPALRVLPGSDRLTRLLDPAEYRGVIGMHRSRRFGAGHEFAELRPYVPGDRLRDLNWAATARRRRPLVNRHHPELAGDVVIALDAFADGSIDATAALARAARTAWTLAAVHFAAQDRVGFAALGGTTRWLSPASGRRAKYELFETLLGIGGEASTGVHARRTQARIAVPSSALVVAITPLQDARTIATLQSWRARGRAVAVVIIDTSDLLAAPASRAEVLARRMWQLQHESRKRRLTDVGIPVVTLGREGSVAAVVAALRRMPKTMSRMVRA